MGETSVPRSSLHFVFGRKTTYLPFPFFFPSFFLCIINSDIFGIADPSRESREREEKKVCLQWKQKRRKVSFQRCWCKFLAW